MYKLIDTHIHSNLSPDGKQSADDIAAAAVELGIDYIAITDHCDPNYCDPRFVGLTSFEDYYRRLVRARRRSKGVYIASGVEIGFLPSAVDIAARIVSRHEFDYVINSVHQVGEEDCYFAKFFDNRTIDEGYRAYFQAVLDSVRAPYRYDAIAHLGYVSRNAPFAERGLVRDSTLPLIEQILREIIERDIILELNTSVNSAEFPCLPSPELLEMYVKMGGRRITFASDAHKPGELLRGYDLASKIALDLGLDKWTVCRQRKRIEVDILPQN